MENIIKQEINFVFETTKTNKEAITKIKNNRDLVAMMVGYFIAIDDSSSKDCEGLNEK